MCEAFPGAIASPPLAGHGGDLLAARLAYPQAPEPWLDLSTGANPYSYPLGDLPPECFTRLPCPSELRALEEAAAKAYGAPAHAQIIAAPGSQDIINWLPRLLPTHRAGILGFTYSEHARSWAASGAKVTFANDLAALEGQEAVIIVNPNNPDGRRIAAQDLHALAASLSKRGGVLIVDEAFIDLELMASAVPNMPASGMIVLRSFGKTYGLPGLRLGFAAAPFKIAARLRAALGPWPVSGAAIAIGRKALRDSDWLAAIREKLKSDAAAMDEILSAAGFVLLGGTLLFRLVRHPEAQNRFSRLATAGILARRFEERPDWLRFGIIAAENDRSRLRKALGLAKRANASAARPVPA